MKPGRGSSSGSGGGGGVPSNQELLLEEVDYENFDFLKLSSRVALLFLLVVSCILVALGLSRVVGLAQVLVISGVSGVCLSVLLFCCMFSENVSANLSIVAERASSMGTPIRRAKRDARMRSASSGNGSGRAHTKSAPTTAPVSTSDIDDPFASTTVYEVAPGDP